MSNFIEVNAYSDSEAYVAEDATSLPAFSKPGRRVTLIAVAFLLGTVGVVSIGYHYASPASTVPPVFQELEAMKAAADRYVRLEAKSCITQYTTESSQYTLEECAGRCGAINCKVFSRPSTAAATQPSKCWTTVQGETNGNCNEYVYQRKAPATAPSTTQAPIQSATGASTCPSGSVNIADEMTCLKAGAALGLTPWGATVVAWSTSQGGCITANGGFGLNTVQGSTHSGFALVCKAQTKYTRRADSDGCAISGGRRHERCYCPHKNLAFCKDQCDSDAACVGYAEKIHSVACQYATTSTCNAECSKYSAGNVGEITPGLGTTGCGACYVKAR